MNNLKFTYDKLHIEQIQELASLPKCEAISIFAGTASDDFDREEVSVLSYEVYESMALKNLELICEEIREKWPEVRNIVIHHRLGPMPAAGAKEASIVIAISSPNRKGAIDATEYCINCVKSRVPIWKKAMYKDEKPEWKKNDTSYPPKRKIYHMKKKQRVYSPYTQQSNQIQIKVTSKEIDDRIGKLMSGRRREIDKNNIQEFIDPNSDPEIICARTGSPLKSSVHSDSHLSDDLSKNNSHINLSPSGIEEIHQNSEIQLSSNAAPIPKCFYERLKNCEDRLLFLESESPGYISFWNRAFTKTKRKRVYSINEIDSLIDKLERKAEKR